jgi:hypothetical protein
MFLEKGNCDLAIRHYSLSSSVLAPPRLFVALFAAMVPSVLLRASAVNPLLGFAFFHVKPATLPGA